VLAACWLAAPAWAQEASPPPATNVGGAGPFGRLESGPGDQEAKADFQETRPLPDRSPLRIANRFGSAALYGFAELDLLHDSTQGFGLAANNFALRPGFPLPAGGGQWQVTPCDSRLGARLETSAERPVRGIFLAELGPAYQIGDGPDFCRGGHVRHLYVAMRSLVLDVLVGKYYGVFGWGGKGFLPNSAAFMGVPGQIYDLERQIRLSHIFRWDPVDFEIAGALADPVQTEPGTGEGHLGFRWAVNGWRGASAQGGGPPEAAPLQVGISGVRRIFEIAPFIGVPESERIRARGQGLALDAFLPIVPAHGDDLGNSLSATLKLTRGSGLADMYTGLTGGVRFPALPNPANVLPAPVYPANIAQGIVAFDPTGGLHPVEWHTVVLGAQYHVPVARGRRVWVCALYSRTESDNATSLTPFPNWYYVWTSARYYDANLFVAVTRALQLAVSWQLTQQVYGAAGRASSTRGQLAATYFF
jgi:hypothetical protein